MMKVNLVLLLTALEPVWSRVAPPTCSTHPNQLIPDPGGDCTVFYQCLATTSEDKHKFVCPAGLVFNPEKSLCDWPPAGADTTSCSFPTPLQPTNRSTEELTKLLFVFAKYLSKKLSKMYKSIIFEISKPTNIIALILL